MSLQTTNYRDVVKNINQSTKIHRGRDAQIFKHHLVQLGHISSDKQSLLVCFKPLSITRPRPADPAEGDRPLTCVQASCSTLVLIHDVFGGSSLLQTLSLQGDRVPRNRDSPAKAPAANFGGLTASPSPVPPVFLRELQIFGRSSPGDGEFREDYRLARV